VGVASVLALILTALVFTAGPAAARQLKPPVMPKTVRPGQVMIAKGWMPRGLWTTLLAVKIGGKWHVVGSGKTTRKGFYRLRAKAPRKPGRYVYRVATPPERKVSPVVSPPRWVRVIARRPARSG
jgi:hypothetical protein